MSLIESEKLVERRISETCVWRSISADLELSDYQYLYAKVMNHLFSGCNTYIKDNRYFMHFESLSLSEQLHNNKVKQMEQLVNSLEKDYLFPHSIDLLYLNHYSSDRVQSLLGNLSREVALVKDFNNEYILIGNRETLNKAKKSLIQFDQLICNQFFIPDSILHFLEKQSVPNIYSVIECMLNYQVQVHPKEVVSQIKEKKRITNIRPQLVNKEYVFRSDCPFNTSFHFVIEGKSPQSFLKKFPSTNKVVLMNPSLWKQLSFVEQAQRDLETKQIEGALTELDSNSSVYPGDDPSVKSTANPVMLSLLESTCQDSIFHVMSSNSILENWYSDMNELQRNTIILTTEESFIQDDQLNTKLLTTSFTSLLSLLDNFMQTSPQQQSISFILPTLLPSQYQSLEASYLTQLFCVFLQKARSFTSSLDITIHFLIQDTSRLKEYKTSFEKLISSASFSSSTQKESVVLIGMKKEMKEVVPFFTELLNDISSFSTVWNKSIPIQPASPFSLVSWNILAAKYAKAKYWTHVPPAFLKSKYRHSLIQEFLSSHQPSFFCLQECDDYFSYWKGAFASLGYSSVYLKRPNPKEDGCCIGYDSTQYAYEKHWTLHFDDLDSIVQLDKERIGFVENGRNEIFEDNEEWKIRASSYTAGEVPREKVSNTTGLLKTQVETCFTQNIALVCLFRDVKTNHQILVATTHLFWNPKYYQIKLYQSMYLLRAIQLIREREGKEIPVFITMDSNTLPYSVVYNYYCSLNSFIPLHSAYEKYYYDQEPLVTNYSYDFIGCLDYIFFNPGVNYSFEKFGVMDLPSIHVFKDLDSLPSSTIPSDHIPIALFGKIHSVKREADPSWTTRPSVRPVRAEMDRPFFKHVYFGYFVC